MTEESKRIVEGLRYCAHCASEGAPCENCPIYEECRSLVAKLALEAIEKLMREREEREDLLDAAFSTIVELQEAQRPNWTPMSEPPKEKLRAKTMGNEPFGTLPLGLKNMRDLLWGDNLPYKTQMFENGAVIAIPSFEPGRVASIVHTYTRWDDKRVRVCLTDAPGESVVCTPEEALKLIRRRLEYAGLI